MTKGEFFELFNDVHDDTIIAIHTPAGPQPIESVIEKNLITSHSEVSAVMILIPERNAE